MQSYSQHAQDSFVYETYFKNRTEPGVFVDIGAYDGVTFSNSYMFERHLGWRGICVERLAEAFDKLKANRSCICLNCAISDYEGEGEFFDIDVDYQNFGKMFNGLKVNYDKRQINRIRPVVQKTKLIKVSIRRLPHVLDENDIRRVDYLSIDTEGSELSILRTLDLDSVSVRVVSVENNYQDPEIRNFMFACGYSLAKIFDGFDELYAK